MTMLLTNTINSEDVRREEFKGREWLVAPLTLVKSMNLHKGYVPEMEVKKSVDAWNGTPLTLNHPRDASGDLVSANSPSVAEKTWIGHVFNAESREDDTAYVDGEAWLDIENARNLGGKAEQIINDLESGKDISVSSSYFGDKLPSGNYDGEHRNKVKGNLRPDHVAILPEKNGVCGIDDGCMVGVQAANADDHEGDLIVPAFNYLSEARTPSYDGVESSSFTDVSKGLQQIINGLGLDVETPEGVDDPRVPHLTDEQRQQIAELSLLGDPDADELYNLRLFQVVNHNNGNLNENALRSVMGGPGQRADIPDETWQSAANKAADLLSSEFDVEVDGNTDDPGNSGEDLTDDELEKLQQNIDQDDLTKDSTFGKAVKMFNNMIWGTESDESAESDTGSSKHDNMSDKTQELVENHGFKADNLPEEDTECFNAIYNRFVDEDDPDNDPSNNDAVTFETEEEFEQAVNEKVGDLVDDRVEDALAQNQEQQTKNKLADKIISNSEDWEEDDREELLQSNEAVLESLAESATESAGNGAADHRGQIGASPSANADGSSMPSLSASARQKETGGD